MPPVLPIRRSSAPTALAPAFGNSATGIVDGPGQANIDLAFSKTMVFHWPHEVSSLQIRAEFYNALNHPQFAAPDANFTSPSFGVIGSTAVSARVGQLAVKPGVLEMAAKSSVRIVSQAHLRHFWQLSVLTGRQVRFLLYCVIPCLR